MNTKIFMLIFIVLFSYIIYSKTNSIEKGSKSKMKNKLKSNINKQTHNNFNNIDDKPEVSVNLPESINMTPEEFLNSRRKLLFSPTGIIILM